MGASDYKQITVYTDADQKRQIERNASAAGMSVSEYLRERGTSEEAIEDVSAREREIEELQELRRLIGNIAGNVNQIAHHANKNSRISERAARSASQSAEQAADKIIATLDDLY
jgi:membrane-bound lytic murein transglycosylase B